MINTHQISNQIQTNQNVSISMRFSSGSSKYKCPDVRTFSFFIYIRWLEIQLMFDIIKRKRNDTNCKQSDYVTVGVQWRDCTP